MQIGQSACPWIWLLANTFITVASLHRTRKHAAWLSKNRKIFEAVLRWKSMSQQPPPKIQLVNTDQYREDYANSVQIRISVWDFLLVFGRISQTAADSVTIHNATGVYMSPQQAKALMNLLQQNINQYESTFGAIALEPQQHPGGIVQ